MVDLSKIDFYRHFNIPREYVERTVQGGIVSIIGAVLLIILFVSELSDHLTPDLETSVVLEQSQEDFLRVDFDVSFPHLPCRFLEVDVDDVLGTHARDLHKNVRRVRLSAQTGEEIGTVMEKREEGDDIGDALTGAGLVDDGSAEETAAAAELGAKLVNNNDELLDVVSRNRLVFVDYYADWCHWCKALEPTWTKLAQKYHALPERQAVIAKIDCESEGGRELCRKKNIMGYPTMLAYRNGKVQAHDVYQGERTVEALSKFVEEELAKAKLIVEQPHLFPDEEHNKRAKYTQAEGCRLWGHLYVKRVPGNFHFTLKSQTHNIAASMVDLSHKVNHLAFNDLVHSLTPAEIESLPAEVRDGHQINRLDAQVFTPESTSAMFDPTKHTKDLVSYEHFMRVVGGTFAFSSSRKVHTYRYTAYSQAVINAQAEEDSFRDARQYGQAHAYFRYDFSPLGTYHAPEPRSWVALFIKLGFVIGGMFTMFGLILNMGNSAAAIVKKKSEIGKLG